MSTLPNTALFSGISEAELDILLGCLGAQARHYEKKEYIRHSGDRLETIGLVIDGLVHEVQEDFWGRRTIVTTVAAGDLFGEAVTYADNKVLPVALYAARPTDVLHIDYRRLITTCGAACSFHTRLIQNMLTILAEKNLQLTEKMAVLNRRTTREKLLLYLSSQARSAGANRFTIPYNRQELADFLSVERSAMSAELSKLRRDGIIDYNRSNFVLLLPEEVDNDVLPL